MGDRGPLIANLPPRPIHKSSQRSPNTHKIIPSPPHHLLRTPRHHHHHRPPLRRNLHLRRSKRHPRRSPVSRGKVVDPPSVNRALLPLRLARPPPQIPPRIPSRASSAPNLLPLPP